MIVEPDSILSDVPWQALVDPQGEYLGSRFAIVVSPGLGYWLDLTLARRNLSRENGPSRGDALARFLSRFPLSSAAGCGPGSPKRVASQFLHARACSLERKSRPLAIQQELARSRCISLCWARRLGSQTERPRPRVSLTNRTEMRMNRHFFRRATWNKHCFNGCNSLCCPLVLLRKQRKGLRDQTLLSAASSVQAFRT